jgi:hypothetical protein
MVFEILAGTTTTTTQTVAILATLRNKPLRSKVFSNGYFFLLLAIVKRPKAYRVSLLAMATEISKLAIVKDSATVNILSTVFSRRKPIPVSSCFLAYPS